MQSIVSTLFVISLLIDIIYNFYGLFIEIIKLRKKFVFILRVKKEIWI